jgi:hypothetical protein
MSRPGVPRYLRDLDGQLLQRSSDLRRAIALHMENYFNLATRVRLEQRQSGSLNDFAFTSDAQDSTQESRSH